MIKVTITKNDTKSVEAMLEGELDTAAIESFNSQITPVMAEKGKEIVLDLTKLKYMSSAGLRAMLYNNKQALAAGGSITLKGMSSDIRQIFQLTGCEKLFKVE